jgi:cell division transport system permease protein
MAWVRLHALALASAIRRLAGQPFASAMSIAVLAIAIAIPVVAAVALRSAGAAAAVVDTDPRVHVYLALDASDADVKRIERALAAHRDAAQVQFVSRNQAFEELKSTTHLAEILATLERNPLPHAFTVRVRPEARERAAALRADWLAVPGVDEVQADFEWSQRLARWVRLGERLLLSAWILLGSAVAFIVGHLIRLQVLTRKEEIEVSQLIGATAADVRRPFLYHGALQGLLAGGLALAAAWGIAAGAAHELRALAPNYASELKVVFLDPADMAAVVVTALTLGLAGAWIAVGRELQRFSASGARR